MGELVRVEHHDRVVSLTLNRPERRNAMSLGLLRALSGTLSDEVPDDATAVILSGAGGCFSAGADLGELSGTRADLSVDDAIERVTRAVRDLPVPVIGAIDGPCLGGAFDLAMSCDLRIASASAFFQVPATRMGLLYNPRSVVRMRKLLGRDAAFRLLVLGERFDAEEALRAGIVSSVVPKDGSYEAAMAIARRAADNVPAAVAATKGLLNAADGDDGEARRWDSLREKLLSSLERREAVARAQARLKAPE
jgi:enoyl-CoA hydratase/carnithine racemase